MKMKKFLLLFLLAFVAITLVACGNDSGKDGGEDTPVVDYTEAAQAFLDKVKVTAAAGDSLTSVTKDITLGTIDNAEVTLSWASNNAAISKDGKVTRGENDVEVTITVTLKYKDVTLTKDFKVTVKAEEKTPEPTAVSSIAEALAAAMGTNVRVQGTVVAVNSKGFYVWDGTGFISVYLTTTAFTQNVGDYVDVEGALGQYNNVNQFTDGCTINALTEGTEYTEAAAELDATTVGAYIEAGVTLGKKIMAEVVVSSVSKSYVNALFKGSETFGLALNAPTQSFEVGATYQVELFVTHAKEYSGVNNIYGYVESAVMTEPAPLPEYTITFDSNGGSAIAPVVFTDWSTITLTDYEPALFGKFFFGWKDADGNAVEEITENKDYALVAEWMDADCTITVDLDGGAFATANYLDANNKKKFDKAIYAYEIEIPTKEGFVFMGWMDAAGVVTNEFAGEVDIKAKWATNLSVILNCGPNTELQADMAAAYLADFNAFTGKNITDKTKFFDLTYTAAGTTFVGNMFQDATYGPKWAWLLKFVDEVRAANGLDSIVDAANAQQRGDIHNWLNACEAGECGGLAGYGQSFKNLDNYYYEISVKGTSYALPTLATTGYTFGGWFTNPSYLGDAVTTATNGLSLYAKWTKDVYTIEYVLPDGTTNSAKNPASYTYFDAEIVLENGTVAEGNSFVGWYADAEFTQPVSKIAAGSTGNVKLYARVMAGDVVQIKFDYQNGDAVKTDVLVKGAEITETATKAQHTFLGWFDNADGEGEAITTVPTEATTLYACYHAPTTLYVAKETTPLYADVKAIADAFMADYNAKNGKSKTAAELDTSTSEGSWLVATLTDATLAAKWDWLLKALYNAAENPEGCDPANCNYNDGSVKGFYISNLYGFFNGQQHTDTNLKTVSVDYSNAENTNKVLARVPVAHKVYISIADALEAAYDYDTIVVEAGTYPAALTVNKQVKFVGPNADKAGDATDRVEEAIITGTIDVNANNVSFNGFKFAGDDVTLADCYNNKEARKIKVAVGTEGFTLINNVVTCANVFVSMADNSKTVISNNFFNWTPETTAGTIYWRPIRTDGIGTDFTFENNKIFETAKGDDANGFYDVLYFVNVAGTININNNDICFASYNWLFNLAKTSANSIINIKNNKVYGSDAGKAAGFSITFTDPTTEINVIGNEFDAAGISFSIMAGKPNTLNNDIAATQTGVITITGNKFLGDYKPRLNATYPADKVVIENNYIKSGVVTAAGTQYLTVTLDKDFTNELAFISKMNDINKTTKYTVTLDGQAYEVYDVIGYVLPTLTFPGNEFLGWYDGDTKVETLTEMKDYVLSSKWANGFGITFDTDGGNEVQPITYNSVAEIVMPAAPTKDGFEFAGWYYGDPEVAFEVKADMVLQNYALKAHWAVKFDITYVFEDGATTDEVETKSALDLPYAITKAPTREGYDFAGWYNGDVKVESVTEAAAITLTAHWNKIYTITYDFDGGKAPVYANADEAIDAFIAAYTAYYGVTGVVKTNWSDKMESTCGAATWHYDDFFKANTEWQWYLDFYTKLTTDAAWSYGIEHKYVWRMAMQAYFTQIERTSWPQVYANTAFVNRAVDIMAYAPAKDSATTTTSVLPNANLLTGVTKADVVFAGWYNGDVRVKTITEAADITLKAHWATPVAMEVAEADAALIEEVKPSILVNAAFADATFYTYNGAVYEVGANAFKDLDDAIAAANAGATIYVFAGAYTLNKSTGKGIKVIAASAAATTITLTASITVKGDTEFNGFKFVADNGINFQPAKGLTSFALKNCIIDIYNTVYKAKDSGYGKDAAIVLDNCEFIRCGQFAVWDNNCATCTVTNCKFDIATYSDKVGYIGTAAYNTALFRIRSGNMVFNNNYVKGNMTGNPYFIEYTVADGTLTAMYNTFENTTAPLWLNAAGTATFNKNIYIDATGAAATAPTIAAKCDNGGVFNKDTTFYGSQEDLELANKVAAIEADFCADFVAKTGKTAASTGAGLDTAKIDSGDMANFMNDAALRAKWSWFLKAVWNAAGAPATADPTTLTDFSGCKGFWLCNLCGFFTMKKHSDSYLGDTSVDWSDTVLVKSVVDANAAKQYNTVAEIEAAWLADFNAKNSKSLTSGASLNPDEIDSSQMVAMRSDAALYAKWSWLYKVIWEVNGSPAASDPSIENWDTGALKGFYIANLNGFFTGTTNTQSAWGITSADFTNAALQAQVVAASPAKAN